MGSEMCIRDRVTTGNSVSFTVTVNSLHITSFPAASKILISAEISPSRSDSISPLICQLPFSSTCVVTTICPLLLSVNVTVTNCPGSIPETEPLRVTLFCSALLIIPSISCAIKLAATELSY